MHHLSITHGSCGFDLRYVLCTHPIYHNVRIGSALDLSTVDRDISDMYATSSFVDNIARLGLCSGFYWLLYAHIFSPASFLFLSGNTFIAGYSAPQAKQPQKNITNVANK